MRVVASRRQSTSLRRAERGNRSTGDRGREARSSFRITSFRPDHTSSTAHTFTSTSPSGNASSRTVSSVMSVATFDAFFGQETQIVPSCRSPRSSAPSRFARSVRAVANTCTISMSRPARARNVTPSGTGATRSR
jgi:hypothetical protein